MTDFELVLPGWSKVEGHLKEYGGEVLTRLFTEHPDTQKLFPKFASIPQAQLAGNPAIAAHGEVVLTKLTAILKAKGQFADEVKPLAASHAKTHKIPLANFNLLSNVLIRFLGEKGVYNSNELKALERLMNTVIGKIGCFYKEEGFEG